MRIAVPSLVIAAAPAALAAPTPKEELLKPPPYAEHFVVVSEAGKHGDEWKWALDGGRTAYRQSVLLRGLVYEQDMVVQMDRDGQAVSFEIRGVTPTGDAAESFTIDHSSGDRGIARWKSPVDSGQGEYGGRMYVPYGGTLLGADELLNGFSEIALSPGDPLRLLPSGTATLTPSRKITVDGSKGPQTIQLHLLRGVSKSPIPYWLDSNGELFALNHGLGLLPAGYEHNLAAITAAQEAAIAALAPATAKRFLTAEARRPVLFKNVRIYDAENERFLEGQNVLAAKGKIVSVSGSAPAKLLPRTRVIDGAGKTLVPGLWDSHMHIPDDFAAISELALGVTSYRNPGGSIELAVSQRSRRATGKMLAPEGFTSPIIDQKGPLAAQGSITVGSLEEAIAAVRRIKAAGLPGVKFYTSMNPAWIAPAAAEAHKLGLHVHGHIPAGMRTLDAINAGYDEITHIYFATMQAMPDEVVAKSNGLMRILGPGRYFKDVDLNAEPMRTLIRTMAERKIVLDPTLVVIEGVLLSEAGKVRPAYAPFVGTLPPATERAFKAGGLPLPEDMTRDDARASFRKMGEYVAILRKAGAPIVAGTDGSGIELVRELELYVEGGMSPAQALATATIDAARNVGADKRTGSIAVGKEADLLLVDGDPSANIGALRRVAMVMSDGVLMDGDALRAAAGFTGAPK